MSRKRETFLSNNRGGGIFDRVGSRSMATFLVFMYAATPRAVQRQTRFLPQHLVHFVSVDRTKTISTLITRLRWNNISLVERKGHLPLKEWTDNELNRISKNSIRIHFYLPSHFQEFRLEDFVFGTKLCYHCISFRITQRRVSEIFT